MSAAGRASSSSRSSPRPVCRSSWPTLSTTSPGTPRSAQETDEALALTGKDVGTPIIHFEPPDGVAFFGPVISRLPSEDAAGELWDHVVGLARFPGFAELKRSLREQPQLAALRRATPTAVGKQEDWHGGSRRQKK